MSYRIDPALMAAIDQIFESLSETIWPSGRPENDD